ncbi:hypothetical protein [Novosphingobium colocasiae]|uniref:hypothetical protein n=1 Tax=Novosphingobium colocasiae TaxID=1256513 RepID=UPI0035B2B7A3
MTPSFSKIARSAAMVATLALGLATVPAVQAAPKLTGEERLAKMLEGRVAGEPVSCISLYQTTDTTVIDGTAIVYKVGSTYYVNRPSNAKSLRDDDVMLVKLHSSQLCSVDIVETRDRSTMMYNGFVGLDKFVPYRKVKH